MQEASFWGLLSCGSWVRDCILSNKYVKEVCVIGPSEKAFLECEKEILEKVTSISREEMKQGTVSYTHLDVYKRQVITRTKTHLPAYGPYVYHPEEFENDGFVQPYGDSPLDDEVVGENVYLNVINQAKKYIYITTPYLIIDNEMMTALCLASKKGIDVRIITPGIPDKKLVFLLTRSYYRQLLEAGVKIYEYTPGFIHAKSFVCDDELAVVGTINLDYRSLYLHFECAAWMYQCQAVGQVKEDMLNTFRNSREVSLNTCKEQNVFRRGLQSIPVSYTHLLWDVTKIWQILRKCWECWWRTDIHLPMMKQKQKSLW